ncbi:MAG: Hsp20/alpha crystallin family protein [Deltaproteobacteria bacterium]|nr:Hsp20/alpha crystallin family protein [Deltaproteobacteria bacterium]
MLATMRAMNPWPGTARFERNMDTMLSSMRNIRPAAYPALNVFSNEDDLVITSEIPGVDPEDVEISIEGDSLTIKGLRKADDLQPGEKWHRRERGNGNFTRTLRLPYNVESSRVVADYKNGVLMITLPRAEADKPRKIQVKTAQ